MIGFCQKKRNKLKFMFAVLIGFLSLFLVINILPVPDSFSSEADIHAFSEQGREFLSRSQDDLDDFVVENFPQLHFNISRAKAGMNAIPQEKTGQIAGEFDFSDFDPGEASAALWDPVDRRFLYEKEAEEEVSIASITKLMTALVFLENNPGWDKVHEISRDDRKEGGRIYLFLGDRVRIKDLFHTSLTASANTATMALVHATGLTEEEFVKKMNLKTESIGLVNTSFQDVTGLSNNNISNAKEVARLAEVALSKPEIREATLTEEYEFYTEQGKKVRVSSTRTPVKDEEYQDLEFLGGKTGYTDQAGYCFVGKFKDKQRNGGLVSVILGAGEREERIIKAQELSERAHLLFD